MRSPTLYIVAGPNGAGKTTASLKILPKLWACSEFVNADEITRGISPLNPESVAVEAGRIMLGRIDRLLTAGATFCIETTLAARNYVRLIERARTVGYKVELAFFWLPSTQVARERVAKACG